MRPDRFFLGNLFVRRRHNLWGISHIIFFSSICLMNSVYRTLIGEFRTEHRKHEHTIVFRFCGQFEKSYSLERILEGI